MSHLPFTSLRFYILVGLTSLLLWYGSFKLSNHLIAPPPLVHRQVAEIPDELRSKLSLADSDGSNRDLQLETANLLVSRGREDRNVQLIMLGIERLRGMLETWPNDPEALLSLAQISFEHGVFESALKYYEQYLGLNPQDKRARTDVGLIYLQIGRVDEAITIFEEIKRQDPDLFQLRLSLALAYRLADRIDEAKLEANQARLVAPHAEAEGVVDSFLNALEAPDSFGPVSPAARVASFIQAHPIIAPKIVSVRWTSESEVQIVLEEFPVEAMPQVARERFVNSVKENLNDLTEEIELTFRDSLTNKVLIQISAGGTSLSPDQQQN